MTGTSATARVLASACIPGLDIHDALTRMGNSTKIYMRVVHSFTQNMPANLEALESVSADTLADYAIRVHGVKGSCYGIGANSCGDAAKELEIASKDGNIDAVVRGNDGFLQLMRSLLLELGKLETEVAAAEADEEGGSPNLAQRPDPEKLAALLAATQSFDIDQMQTLLDELDAVRYQSGGDLIVYLKDRFAAFDYQAIEDKIAESR
ncbi:MAG: hypothetical protein LBU07_00065 [Coriobacteriales bacterium]|jgi:HPt (histidine-containing phosphotransfer) domain-containing protein|nr:hypothetical protein [Coriobacteriales bacterium]